MAMHGQNDEEFDDDAGQISHGGSTSKSIIETYKEMVRNFLKRYIIIVLIIK
jgi:hypothetical protein